MLAAVSSQEVSMPKMVVKAAICPVMLCRLDFDQGRCSTHLLEFANEAHTHWNPGIAIGFGAGA
jgi:hypothetical protein